MASIAASFLYCRLRRDGRAAEARASVNPKDFQRLISNLANNAVEAFENGGTLTVILYSRDGEITIELKDDGKGIPPGILPKLGLKGETHGKAGGTGLGLYPARAAVESRGGVKGEDIAEDLREKGFSDIKLATGRSPEDFSQLPWLKVTGKEPPFGV
ncbi:MAG: ATP-binding protein [Elusimicrobiota bacterium]|nr:ATP-binding protein [Elusimicrobiota bacterium]